VNGSVASCRTCPSVLLGPRGTRVPVDLPATCSVWRLTPFVLGVGVVPPLDAPVGAAPAEATLLGAAGVVAEPDWNARIEPLAVLPPPICATPVEPVAEF
jgi:hypothetical protein